MPKELRGRRYLTVRNLWLQKFIQEELPYLDYYETCDWYAANALDLDLPGQAFLACNDRFYLLTGLLNRVDLLHPWLFDRCREVEADPDGHIDLWARGHGKSSIVTCGGIIQEIVCDPEITIAIFSVVKPIAIEFLAQIKTEFETNDKLKEVFPDVLYQNPNRRGPDGKPAKWGTARGLTVKRKQRPKEATLEAHGLIDGQPTGRHFRMHVYDDVVTQDNLTEGQLKKTTLRFEMADNLGTRLGVRKQIAGTRYHFADAYGQIIEKGSAKPRIYPATFDGTLANTRTLKDGTVVSNLVLLTVENWERIKRDQSKVVAAQMLLDPLAGTEATFKTEWLRWYEVIPAVMNVYILVDPSKGSGERSDRTAIPVIGIDQGGNKYLLDGVRHRMKLSDRWAYIKAFRRKWMAHPGVQMVRVGYEQYGMLNDLEVLEDTMQREQEHFEIVELNTPRTGGHSKDDRVERLEPDIREGRFYLPCVTYHPDFGGNCYWSVWTAEHEKKASASAIKHDYVVGQIIYRKAEGPTKRQTQVKPERVVTPLRRRDENSEIYDVTRAFIDEMRLHPFGTHDDLIDAVARIYDMEPCAPIAYERQSTEPLGLEGEVGTAVEE